MRCCCLVLLVASVAGCAASRSVTISTRPEDADLSIDGAPRGKAPLTENFVFANDTEIHFVTASRPGYKDQTVRVTKTDDSPALQIDLHPQSKHVSFTVMPVPAVISVDGRPLGPDPVTQTSVDLDFTLDADNHWTTHTVTAERPGYKKVEQKINWTDPSPDYVLTLDVMRKDVTITTSPPGGNVTINGEEMGVTPLTISGFPFPVKPDTNEWIPQHVHITKPGYDAVDTTIAWDDGRTSYSFAIPPQQKTVRVTTVPRGAEVKIDGVATTTDASGATTAKLVFTPTDDKGTLRTFSGTAAKAPGETIWQPLTFTLHWDEGKTEYTLPLKEIKTRQVALLRVRLSHTDENWTVLPERITTVGMKNVDEQGSMTGLTKMTDLSKEAMIDTLTVSPDGSQVLFTTLTSSSPAELLSAMTAVRADGSGVTTMFGDGKSLDLTPSYTPDGSQIVFASNRGGRRLSIWEISAAGDPGVTQLTNSEESDLWPMVDSDPKPRLFYEALIDTRSDPRLYMTQLGATTRTDLTRAGGMQPRVSPKGDSILFCAPNEKTGKRQIFRMPDRGGVPVTLSSPDADEFDAVWSLDGTRIAYVSDRGTDDENRNNYDIWILDTNDPERPTRVTYNGSWDDCPAWDPSGRAIYFRSNRGGSWNIWKIALKSPGN